MQLLLSLCDDFEKSKNKKLTILLEFNNISIIFFIFKVFAL